MQYLMGHFTGNGSIFCRMLSPEVITSGKGFVKPGYGGLLQYTEDAQAVGPVALHDNKWPNGFYTDDRTKRKQFYVNTTAALVLLPALPGNNDMPLVAPKPITAESVWKPLNRALAPRDVLVLKDHLESLLTNMNLAGQPS